MKILVTGCAGMIGTKLVEMLINSNIPVVGCDNFFRGKKDNIDYLNKKGYDPKTIDEVMKLAHI
jgi:nucleoside-diphosphate-sugar epimerase